MIKGTFKLPSSCLMALAFGLLAVWNLRAQEFVRSVPSHAGMSDAERRGLYTTEELSGDPSSAGASEPAGTLSTEETDRLVEQYRRQAGTLGPSRLFSASRVGFHFGVGVAYDDNIRTSTADHKEADEITTLTGGVNVSLGDFTARENSFLLFDYTLSENIFATHGDEDALDQSGLLDARYRWQRFSTEFVSRFQAAHDPTADTAERERRYLYDESLAFQYRYGDKTLLTSRPSYDRDDAAQGDSNQQYAWENSVDYQAFDKLKLGVGLVVGRLEADGGLGETFEQPLARLEWAVSGKVSLLAQAGVDVRERGSHADDLTTPVFALEGRWTPYDGTTVSLSGFRRVDASVSISGEDFINSTVQLDLRQRFLRRFFLLVNSGYTHSDYENVTGGDLPPRTDDYYFARAGVTYEAEKYFDVGLFYQREQNSSTNAIYSFASNRVYLRSNFVY